MPAAVQMVLALPDVDAPSGEEWQRTPCPASFAGSRQDRVGVSYAKAWDSRSRQHVDVCFSARLSSVVESRTLRLDHHGYPHLNLGGQRVYLHRLAFGDAPSGKFVDHRDRNPLNCADDNLRAVSPAESSVNRGRPRLARPASSRFKNVTAFYLAGGRVVWQAGFGCAGRFHHCGLHATETAAAIAVNRALRKQWPTLYVRNHIPVRRTVTTAWASVSTQPTTRRKAA